MIEDYQEKFDEATGKVYELEQEIEEKDKQLLKHKEILEDTFRNVTELNRDKAHLESKLEVRTNYALVRIKD